MDLDDKILGLMAATLDDIEGQRKAAVNRLRQLTTSEPDKDGEMRGFGLDESHPSVLAQKIVIEMIEATEKQAVKNLEKQMKQHALGPWVLEQKGLGLKTVGRLLGEIGDPYYMRRHMRHPSEKTETGKPKLILIEERPRTVSELWAYCGLNVANGAAPRLRAGQQANWKTMARTRAYCLLDPIVKAKNNPGKYTTLYYDTKERLQGSVYTEEYVAAYPKSKAKAGESIPPWLIQNRAKRVVMKEILKDLWLESKRLHEAASPGHLDIETHTVDARGSKPKKVA